MLRLSLFVAVLALTSACAEQKPKVYSLFDGRLDVTLPGGYKPDDSPNPNWRPSSTDEVADRQQFLLFGGNAALSEKFPDSSNSPTFLDRFAGKDVQASIGITLVNLIPNSNDGEWVWHDSGWVVPRNATAREIHEKICADFVSQWGDYSFAYFDPETEIGSCVNVVGAFISLFARRVESSLVLVSSMDFVEVLSLEKKHPAKPFSEMTRAEKWQTFRAAANADVVEQVLLSAKVYPGSQ